MIQDFNIVKINTLNRKQDYIDIKNRKLIIKSIAEVHKYVTILSKPNNLKRIVYYICFSDKPFNFDSVKTGIDGYGTYKINIDSIFYFLGLDKDINVKLELYEKDTSNVDNVDIKYNVYQLIC